MRDPFGAVFGPGLRRRPAREPVGEPHVKPSDERGTERQARPQVEPGEHVHHSDVGAAVQIDRRRDHQHRVERRNTREHDGAGAAQTNQVPKDHAKAQQHPQPDLAAHYHRGDRILREERQHCLLDFHSFGSTFVLIQ